MSFDPVGWFVTQYTELCAFFGPVRNSIKGQINQVELQRIVITALSCTSITSVLQLFAENSNTLFTSPNFATSVSGWATVAVAAFEAYRRLHQDTPNDKEIK